MPRLIVNAPSGGQELLELGVGGSYFDFSRVVWCFDHDGNPPVPVTLGAMERIEKIEPVKDENGKQLYGIIEKGDHKLDRLKVPLRQRVVYLRNNQLRKTAASIKPPTRLPLEE